MECFAGSAIGGVNGKPFFTNEEVPKWRITTNSWVQDYYIRISNGDTKICHQAIDIML